MSYRFTAADRSAPTRVGQTPWLRSQLPEELGTCFTDQLLFEDGLSVVYSNYHPRHHLVETSTQERQRALTVAIALDGRSSSTASNGQRFDFVSGHSTIAAYGCLHGERHYPANQAIRQVRLIAQEALLHKYGLMGLLEGGAKGQSTHHLFCGKHGAATQRLAESLIHLHDHAGSLLDTHITALGLLSEQISPFTPQQPTTTMAHAQNQDIMMRARGIMMSQYDRPLTVGYLCTAVGTNEFKLKQGFRTLFGTSPHRMLTDIRMAKAWELLETGLQVSTVAYKVGFQHLSSFSSAFERYYGRTAKSVAGPKVNGKE
ncbi:MULTISPECIES: helix-turn-helix transcriptional regulator [unclassified Pseudomonas]|uniref:helix-turn-helix transcriptional regulator n=1 Tax=unclassified Pseudomonas TaxID=196821 RepID=UPI00216019AB|nr:AraC family transcriptional regulator [Pseudomonas sp. B21-048]UVK97152.1 AraC family transcriptional regulator [Pseudomonas sp. B21-048]